MTQKVTITVKRKPKPQQGSAQPKRGRIDLATPSKRPTRRRLQKGGIRFFDLGVYRQEESWLTYQHTLGSSPGIWSKISNTPREEWASKYRQITESLHRNFYKLVSIEWLTSQFRDLDELGEWRGNSFKFSDDGLALMATSDLTDSFSKNYAMDDNFVVTEGAEFGTLVNTYFKSGWTIRDDQIIVTNSTEPPTSVEENIDYELLPDGDWYLMPEIPQWTAYFQILPVSDDWIYTINSRPSTEWFNNYPTLRAILDREPVEYVTAGIGGQFGYMTNIFNPVANVTVQRVLDHPETLRYMGLTPAPKPSSMGAVNFGGGGISRYWQLSMPPDFPDETRPLMVIHQESKWYYFWYVKGLFPD